MRKSSACNRLMNTRDLILRYVQRDVETRMNLCPNSNFMSKKKEEMN